MDPPMTTEALLMPEKPAQPDHDRPFGTVAQTAEHWQCSEKKVRRLIKKGELIAHRFGNQLRITPADRRSYERLHRED